MRRRRRRLGVLAVAIGLECEELKAIIREQQHQLEELSRKVDTLNDRSQAGTAAETPPPSETAQKVRSTSPTSR